MRLAASKKSAELVGFENYQTLSNRLCKLGTKDCRGSKCSVELHVCRQEKIPDDRLRSSIDDELSSFCNNFAGSERKIFPKQGFYRPANLRRRVGAPMPKDQRKRRVRWLVIMTHVAIGKRRESSTEPCTWSLFDRKSASTRLKQIKNRFCQTNKNRIADQSELLNTWAQSE